jgi:predicted Zn-dependent protease
MRRDRRTATLLAVIAAVALAGFALQWRDSREPAGEPREAMADHVRRMQRAEFAAGFQQAAVMLHARQYEHAVTALHRLLTIDPAVPEVHVNMGFALLGLKRPDAARDFFESATQLKPGQANAYYGMAVALESLGDLPGALGAMRTYVHLTTPDDPWLPKARAALWEWQSRGASSGEGRKP